MRTRDEKILCKILHYIKITSFFLSSFLSFSTRCSRDILHARLRTHVRYVCALRGRKYVCVRGAQNDVLWCARSFGCTAAYDVVQKKDKCIRWRLSKIEKRGIMNFYYWKQKPFAFDSFISCIIKHHPTMWFRTRKRVCEKSRDDGSHHFLLQSSSSRF